MTGKKLRTSKARVWFTATRPKTLPAALTPVLIGVGFSWARGCFDASIAALIACCALLIQIGTNFANDVADFERGTDTEERLGPQRAVQAGLISAKQMWLATVLTLGLALSIGIYLVAVGGWPILVIGLSALAFAVLYSVGPLALSYTGTADLFVFAYFGPVATLGTEYLLCATATAACFWAGVAAGALATAILAVNNLRDHLTDARTKKRTLAVRFGPAFARAQISVLLLLPALIVSLLAWSDYSLRATVFSLFYLAPASAQVRLIYSGAIGTQLNAVLAGIGRTLLLFGLLFTLGLVS